MVQWCVKVAYALNQPFLQSTAQNLNHVHKCTRPNAKIDAKRVGQQSNEPHPHRVVLHLAARRCKLIHGLACAIAFAPSCIIEIPVSSPAACWPKFHLVCTNFFLRNMRQRKIDQACRRPTSQFHPKIASNLILCSGLSGNGSFQKIEKKKFKCHLSYCRK